MKFKFTCLITAFVLFTLQLHAQRYLTEIFTNVEVTQGVQYGSNYTVITGSPTLQNLYVNIYEPEGDTVTDRPLVLFAHTGSFLPVPQNGQTTGDTSDYAAKTIATRLAKMGYVAATFTYRKGWNPLDSTAELRRRGLINAAYKGIQDIRTLARFFRESVANGNPYGVDPDKIAAWGNGTGGYIALNAAVLTQDEIYIPKFLDPISGVPFIDTMLWGNLDGTTAGLFNVINHPGYNSDLQFAFNAGGALGDISWLDAGEPPVIAAHVIKDPFAPFGYDFVSNQVVCEGPVIVPTTQEFVVNVAGSKCIINTANNNGVNASLLSAGFNDPITIKLESELLAEPNLWAIWTQSIQAGPWDYWDAAYWSQIPHPSCGTTLPPDCSFHTISLQTNPDMSLTKANHYIDTLIWFFAPRANHVLNVLTAVDEVLMDVDINVYPNPAGNMVWVEMENGELMEKVELFDLQGKLVGSSPGIMAPSFEIKRNNLPEGMYILKVHLKEGVAARRIIFR